MAKDKDVKSSIDITNEKCVDFYNKAYLKLEKMSENEMDFEGILSALIVTQEQYSSSARNTRNIFFVNSLHKSGLIYFDKGLPERVNIWEYYCILSKPSEEEFEKNNNGIFKNFDQMKKFYISFMNRFFKNGIEEYSFFDKIVFNTLIKSRLIVRYDSSLEDINTTAKAFFNSVNI